MTAREYLGQVQVLDTRIESKLNQIRALRELVTNPCGHISGMPHNPSPDRQPIQSVVSKIADLEKDVDADVDELVNLKQNAINMLQLLMNPYHTQLLELRYIDRETWKTIADKLPFCESHLYRLHAEALDNFEKLLANES
jgi:hypothetical protein